MNHHCKYCGITITHNTLGWAAHGVPGNELIRWHDHEPYDALEELALQSIEQKGTS